MITYHPALNKVSGILRKHFYLLQSREETKKVFPIPPMVSFRSSKKLKNFLVRAKLPPLEKQRGSRKCGKSRCQVCHQVNETEEFQSSFDERKYKINFKLDCDEKCVIYLLTCKVCSKQYVGQTTDKFRFRWNNYKANHRKARKNEPHFQTYFHHHFVQERHNGLEDIIITFIDKADGSDPTKRESFWINRLHTKAPFGLNVVE